MIIAYLSLSGNVRDFVKGVGMDSVELEYFNPCTKIGEDFIVITPSYDEDITDIISEFIDYEDNINHLMGFVGSGNKNFGKDGYCFNAIELSQKYSKPLLLKFEFCGTDNDITIFKKEVDKIEISRIE